jgi:hypothetical protein
MQDRESEYQSCVQSSERLAWRLDDVFPSDQRLDFEHDFLPDALVSIDRIACLSPAERRTLNQIRGNSYAHLFGFVEEYIIGMTVSQASGAVSRSGMHLRALLRFAEEEVKHRELFRRYNAAFNRDFKTPVDVIGAADAVAAVILGKSRLGVLIVTMHLELLTQQHYVESVRDNTRADLDPLFSTILKRHWLEEAQHARIDFLEALELAEKATPEELDTAMRDYADILAAFDGLLGQQAEMDLQSLERAVERTFTEAERAEILGSQRPAYRRLFIGMGLTNAGFVSRMGQISADAQRRVNELVPLYV